jgi:small subunit ribosomal protein S18
VDNPLKSASRLVRRLAASEVTVSWRPARDCVSATAAKGHEKCRLTPPVGPARCSLHFLTMSTTEQPQRSLTPIEIPFTSPEMLVRQKTDTGKILPRKYTHLSAKEQRAITRTIKRSRNMLLAQ